MAQLPDPTGPTTSYSDPIYDRLETVAQRVTRWLGLIVLAIVVIIVIAVVLQRRLADSPQAESANAYLIADKALQEAQHEPAGPEKDEKVADAMKSLQVIAANEKITPFFRARACIELVQADFVKGALVDAKAHAQKAVELAAQSDDKDIVLKAGLTLAATSLQAGQYDEAVKQYDAIEHQAGAKSPDSQITAVLGASLALELQGKLEEAAAKLEPITSRNEANAQTLINIAREHYWRLKSQLADKAKPHSAAAVAPTAAHAVATTSTPAATPAQAAAPVTAPSAPITPVPAPAPVPVPVPVPAGK